MSGDLIFKSLSSIADHEEMQMVEVLVSGIPSHQTLTAVKMADL